MASQLGKTTQFFQDDSSHGLAKRVILKKGVQAWCPYHLHCGRYSNLYYVDGFSGEGTYGDKEQDKDTEVEQCGSPVIALNCVLDCFQNVAEKLEKQEKETGISPEMLVTNPEMRGTKYGLKQPLSVKLFYVEALKETCHKLKTNLDERKKLYDKEQGDDTRYAKYMSVEWKLENCEFKDSDTITNLDSLVRDNPTFIFIDPFGYSHTPMETVGSLIGKNRTLLITFMVRDINRFKNKFPEKMDKIYGTKEWTKVFDMLDAAARYECLTDIYMKQLQKRGAQYTMSFPMRNSDNHVVYNLVFASSGPESYEILKKFKESFNRASTEPGGLGFSGYKVRDTIVEWKNKQDVEAMATLIFNKFHGQKKELLDIERFIWLETPFIYRTEPLKILEETHRVKNVTLKDEDKSRNKGTFANVLSIEFDSFREEIDGVKIQKPEEITDVKEMSSKIYEAFQGARLVTLEDIDWRLLRHLNLSCKYTKKAIKILEDERKLFFVDPPVGVERHAKGTYPPGCKLNFISSKVLAKQAEMASRLTDKEQLSKEIYNRFQGQSRVTLKDIEKWLQTFGNFKLKKSALKQLEDENKLVYVDPPLGVERNRKGTYPKGCKLNFLSAETGEPSFSTHQQHLEQTNDMVGASPIGDNDDEEEDMDFDDDNDNDQVDLVNVSARFFVCAPVAIDTESRNTELTRDEELEILSQYECV